MADHTKKYKKKSEMKNYTDNKATSELIKM